MKKLANFCGDGYFKFCVKNLQRGVKLCNSDALFLVDWFLTYDQRGEATRIIVKAQVENENGCNI